MKLAIEKGYHQNRQFREELYENLKDDFARTYYNKYISQEVKVDSIEVKNYYEKNKQNYKIWGFVSLKALKWDDTTNLPNDSIFNKDAKLLTFYENLSDSLLYKYFSQKDTNKLFLDKIKDTLYAIQIIKIQKPDYTKLEDVYNSIESNIKFEKEKKLWEQTLDNILSQYGYQELDNDTTKKEIPETLSVIKKLNIYITKADYQNYLSKVPGIYRKAYRTKEGAYELVKIFTQRELLFKEAIVNKRIFITSEGYTTLKRAFENLLISELKKEVLKDVAISENDIKSYYEENKEKQFKIPGNAKVRKLTFDNEKEARKYFNIISNNPQKFDSIAKSIAKDKEEKEFGGFTYVNENDTTLFNRIKNLKLGKPTLIKLNDKWVIISVQELNQSRIRELSEVQDQIKQLLLMRKQDEVWQKFKDEVKSKLDVQILIKQEEKQGG